MADERRVPSVYGNITLAIAACNNDDEIILEEAGSPLTGVFNKNLNLGGLTGIVIRSELGDPTNMVVDCENAYRFIIFNNGETRATKLIGFTIKDGYGDVLNGYGGGVRIISSSPTLEDMIIHGCLAVNLSA